MGASSSQYKVDAPKKDTTILTFKPQAYLILTYRNGPLLRVGPITHSFSTIYILFFVAINLITLIYVVHITKDEKRTGSVTSISFSLFQENNN